LTKALSVSPEELQPNPWNVNVMTPENEAKLDAAIRRFGFFKPITVRETPDGYQILGGEHRWEAAKRLKLDEVPIFSVGKVSDKKAKEIMLADNARYGADDTISLAELLSEIGEPEEIQQYLPWTETDLTQIFSSVDIALDELELSDQFDADEKIVEEKTSKTPKTHTILRFKVAIPDAERITDMITRAQKAQDFTKSDELTNAGDALVHLLGLNQEASSDE
jgi:ParB-like chromosome segregation protein Spo0J